MRPGTACSRGGSAARLCVALALALFSTACVHKANLDRLDGVQPLAAEEAAADQESLARRAGALFEVLKKDKITTYNTKEKLQPFFKDEQDLADFLAIYASSFREYHFQKDRLRGYRVHQVVIEENGVRGLVRIDLVGRLYAFFPTTLKEVQRWEKSEGEWYFIPTAH